MFTCLLFIHGANCQKDKVKEVAFYERVVVWMDIVELFILKCKCVIQLVIDGMVDFLW